MLSENGPTEPPAKIACSRAADRMRRTRARRRDGLACYRIELRTNEIEALVHLGLLPSTERTNHRSVVFALHCFFDETLSRVV